MRNKLEERQHSRFKNVLFSASVAVLILASVSGFYFFSTLILPFRVLISLAVFILALFVASKTIWGAAFLDLIQDAKSELNKVVWPQRKEAMQSTLMVFVMVFVMGIVLWATDSILFHLTAWVTQNVGG